MPTRKMTIINELKMENQWIWAHAHWHVRISKETPSAPDTHAPSTRAARRAHFMLKKVGIKIAIETRLKTTLRGRPRDRVRKPHDHVIARLELHGGAVGQSHLDDLRTTPPERGLGRRTFRNSASAGGGGRG